MLRKKELKKLSFFLFLWWSHWIYKNIFFTSLSLSLSLFSMLALKKFRFVSIFLPPPPPTTHCTAMNQQNLKRVSASKQINNSSSQQVGITANEVDFYVWIIVYVCKRSLSAAKWNSTAANKRNEKKVANSERVSLHSEFIAIKMRKGMKFQKNNTRYVGQWWFITMRYVDFFRATQRHISECLSGDSLIKHQMKRSMT